MAQDGLLTPLYQCAREGKIHCFLRVQFQIVVLVVVFPELFVLSHWFHAKVTRYLQVLRVFSFERPDFFFTALDHLFGHTELRSNSTRKNDTCSINQPNRRLKDAFDTDHVSKCKQEALHRKSIESKDDIALHSRVSNCRKGQEKTCVFPNVPSTHKKIRTPMLLTTWTALPTLVCTAGVLFPCPAGKIWIPKPCGHA